MIERDLRRTMLRPETTLRVTELNHTVLAWVDYEGRRIEVVLDPMRGGLIASVVHELIHATYARDLSKWGKNEESIVVALEQDTMSLVDNNQLMVRWWRNAISRKLDQEAA
jgi:hypothetical protein